MRPQLGIVAALMPACAAVADGEALRLRTIGVVSPQTPSVQLTLRAVFDPSDFAFAGARLDIVTSEGRFVDPSCPLFCAGGAIAGSQVRDLLVGQIHEPAAGVIADSANPIEIYSVRWTTDDFEARVIPVVTDTRTFNVFPSATSPAIESRLSDLREGVGLIRVIPCYADCDGNGALTFFDFICFLNAFSVGDNYADCDQSGAVDFFDFTCYQNAFAAGCS